VRQMNLQARYVANRILRLEYICPIIQIEMKKRLKHTVNWPVSLSNPTCVTCTGFPGAEILTLLDLGEPKTLPIKEESPLFFFQGAELFPLASSEYLFEECTDEVSAASGGVLFIERSPMEKLADWRKEGVIIFAFGVV